LTAAPQGAGRQRVIVVGGGLAGLACAVALADHGVPALVIERDALPGGRARSWTDERTGDAVDIGPHVFHSEYRNMLAFLDRLGTRAAITWQPGRVLTIASKPRPVVLRHWPLPAPLSLLPSILPAPGLSVADFLSMTAVTWHAMRFGKEDVDALDAMSAEEYFRRQGVSEAMIDWWWRFAAMVVCNVPLERCSAAALLRIHAQLSGHQGVHFGFAADGLGELYVRQATRIVEAAGGRVLTGTAVRALAGAGRVAGVVLDDGSRLAARHVVCALPPQALGRLLPPAWAALEPFHALDAFEPSPYLSCYLWFDRRVMAERFVSHLWSPRRLNYDFYDLSRIRRGWEGRPSVVASNIIYSHRAHSLSDDEVIAATVRELAEFAPAAARATLVHARVHRIPMAIPCPVPGSERRRPLPRTDVPGLFVAGDWLRTGLPCTMESAVAGGWMAAEEVLADHGIGVRLALPKRPYDGIAGLVRRVTEAARGRNARGGLG